MSNEYDLEPEGNIDGIPRYVPSIVEAGEYLCQISKAISKRPSPYGENNFYLEWPMIFQDKSGNKFDFLYNFTHKSEIFKSILNVIGGIPIEKGMIDPPKNSVIGKYFMVEVTKELKKGTVAEFRNKIVRIWPYVHKENPSTATKDVPAPSKEIEKEFPKSKEEEEVPF